MGAAAELRQPPTRVYMDMNVSAGCFGLWRRVRNGHDRTSRRKAMALIFCARFRLSNQQPCRWLVAGKDGGEKGCLGTFGVYRL